MSETVISKSPAYRAPITSLLFSLLIQTISFAAASLASESLPSPAAAILIHSGTALLLSSLVGLSPVWRFFNAAVWPAAVAAMNYDLPGGVLAPLLVLAALLYLPTFWTKVPYYPTSKKTYDAVLNALPKDRAFKFIDLGSGLGSLLSYLSRRLPQGSFYGSEISPLGWLISRLRFLLPGRGKARIQFKDFWKIDLGEFDVVYAFLAPPPMARLWEKAKREMRPGTLFVTNSFEVPALASEVVEIDDARQARLYIHRM